MAREHWKIDRSHSEIMFRVKHLMISYITGYFKTFDLELSTEGEDFESAYPIVFKADVMSIDTNNPKRDSHLLSEDFFDVEDHRRIKFVGDDIEVKGSGAILRGFLTIRNVTKPVHLNVELGGIATDPYGQVKAGFRVTGHISRKEFNLHWNGVVEAGQVVVSDEIEINCDIQVIKQSTLKKA